MKRKICVVTGTRADYGIYSPVLRAIKRSSDLDLDIVATGMHLMDEFGMTVKEIEKDGFRVAYKVKAPVRGDNGVSMARASGEALIGMSKAFNRLKPDIVVVLGDRSEMLVACIAANLLNIPVAHIHGGEVSGNVDDLFRHAITKLAHIHFAASAGAKERILRLGEHPARVFKCGAPALDSILHERFTDKEDVLSKYGLASGDRFFIVLQHPVSTQAHDAARQMKITLEAVGSFNVPSIVIYPNSDSGGRSMINIIKLYKKNARFMTVKNIPYRDFLGLLKRANAIVGNSSSGIIEAPSFGVPVINIGIRQNGRERCANIIDVPHSKVKIINAIDRALNDRLFRKMAARCINPYGDGHAAERIVKVLRRIKIDDRLLEKRLSY